VSPQRFAFPTLSVFAWEERERETGNVKVRGTSKNENGSKIQSEGGLENPKRKKITLKRLWGKQVKNQEHDDF